MRRTLTVLLGGVALTTLAACGTQPGERALSGGAIGAGTGAAVGAIAGDVGTGALVGGAVGAALGGLTDADDIYLGDTPF